MVGLIDMERYECESSIHDHDIYFGMTLVGYMDITDSGRGDFRRRRAVDISILYLIAGAAFSNYCSHIVILQNRKVWIHNYIKM